MKYSRIRGPDLTGHLADEWSRIRASTSMLESPFFSLDFTRMNAEVGPDVEIAVIEDGPRIVGFLPYHRDHADAARPIGGRLSDYHGAISDPEAEWNARDLLRALGLRVFLFRNLPPRQPWLDAYAFAAAPAPYLDLADGFEAYVAERNTSSRLIKKLGRKLRKLCREVGEVRFEFSSASNQVFDQLVQWKSEQRARTHTIDVLALPWVRTLLDRLASEASARCRTRVSALWAGEHLVAAHLGLSSRDILHHWFPAYDRAFSKYSPGSLLLLELARSAADAGHRRLDLGKGDDEFKVRFSSGSLPLAEGSVDRSRSRQSIRRAWGHLRTLARHSPFKAALLKPKRWIRRLRSKKPTGLG